MKFLYCNSSKYFRSKSIRNFCFFVNNENKIETRQVEIQYSNKDLAIIKDGLNEGDRVVVSDIVKLKDGLLVNPSEVDNQIKK